MNDTHPKICEILEKMLTTRSGEERLIMGCSMHEFAQEIAASSIKERKNELSEAQMTGELFLCFYGPEFDPVSRSKIYNFLVKQKEARIGSLFGSGLCHKEPLRLASFNCKQ